MTDRRPLARAAVARALSEGLLTTHDVDQLLNILGAVIVQGRDPDDVLDEWRGRPVHTIEPVGSGDKGEIAQQAFRQHMSSCRIAP